jgi:hypothetical protein
MVHAYRSIHLSMSYPETTSPPLPLGNQNVLTPSLFNAQYSVSLCTPPATPPPATNRLFLEDSVSESLSSQAGGGAIRKGGVESRLRDYIPPPSPANKPKI